MYVIVDKRELVSGVPRILEKLGVEFRVGLLKYGDYLIEGKYAVERKTLTDLINSIKSARIFRQLDGLTDGKEVPVLLVEGDWSEIDYRGFRPEALYGFLLMVQEAGIKVMFTRSKMHTAIALKTMVNHDPGSAIVIKPKKIRANDPRIAVLCGIPGIGIKRARALLRRFKTLKNIFNAPWESLADTVGPSAADKIKFILETELEE